MILLVCQPLTNHNSKFVSLLLDIIQSSNNETLMRMLLPSIRKTLLMEAVVNRLSNYNKHDYVDTLPLDEELEFLIWAAEVLRFDVNEVYFSNESIPEGISFLKP